MAKEKNASMTRDKPEINWSLILGTSLVPWDFRQIYKSLANTP